MIGRTTVCSFQMTSNTGPTIPQLIKHYYRALYASQSFIGSRRQIGHYFVLVQ